MNVIERIKAVGSAIRGERRSGRVPDYADFIIDHPFIPVEPLDNFRDAFRKVPVVTQCIKRVQRDASSLPVRVWEGEGEKRKEQLRRDGNLADLLLKANPRQTGYQLRYATYGSLGIQNNAFWFLQRFPGTGKQPRELWELKPHKMEVTPTLNRGVREYRFDQRDLIEPENIIHFEGYSPDDEPIGMSNLEPLRKEWEAYYYALIWLKEFFRKGGMVSGVWSLKKDARPLKDEEIKAIMERLKRLHVGYAKAWDPVFVDMLEFVRRGLTLSEMELDKHLAMVKAEIAVGLGVPPMMVGISDGSKLESSAPTVSMQDYWFGTIGGITMLFDTTLNEQLCPLFGNNLTVETDLAGVLPVQAAYLDQMKALVAATGRPILTVNEARLMAKRTPHKDTTADDLYTRPAPTIGGPGGDNALVRHGRGKRLSSSRVRHPEQRALMIDGDENRESLRRRHATAIQRAEARMTELVKGRVSEQIQTAIERFTKRWNDVAPQLARGVKLTIDISGLVDPADEGDLTKVRKALEQLLQQRAAEASTELSELVEIAEAIEINLTASRVQTFLDTQMERAITVPDGTTERMLRESLQEGIGANEPFDQLVTRMRSVGEARENMAATIARTETIPGFNLASQEVWIESGVVADQEWLTARDDAVRPAHGAADGQTVPIGSLFTVDGEQLEYPGDPSGSAGNVINCRCGLLPVLKEGLARRSRWARFMPAKNGHKPGANRIAGYLAGRKG